RASFEAVLRPEVTTAGQPVRDLTTAEEVSGTTGLFLEGSTDIQLIDEGRLSRGFHRGGSGRHRDGGRPQPGHPRRAGRRRDGHQPRAGAPAAAATGPGRGVPWR